MSLSAPPPPVLGDASTLALLIQLRDAAPQGCLQTADSAGHGACPEGGAGGKGKLFQVGQQRAEGVTLFFSSSLQCDELVGRTWGACPWSLEFWKKVWSWQEGQGSAICRQVGHGCCVHLGLPHLAPGGEAS